MDAGATGCQSPTASLFWKNPKTRGKQNPISCCKRLGRVERPVPVAEVSQQHGIHIPAALPALCSGPRASSRGQGREPDSPCLTSGSLKRAAKAQSPSRKKQHGGERTYVRMDAQNPPLKTNFFGLPTVCREHGYFLNRKAPQQTAPSVPLALRSTALGKGTPAAGRAGGAGSVRCGVTAWVQAVTGGCLEPTSSKVCIPFLRLQRCACRARDLSFQKVLPVPGALTGGPSGRGSPRFGPLGAPTPSSPNAFTAHEPPPVTEEDMCADL